MLTRLYIAKQIIDVMQYELTAALASLGIASHWLNTLYSRDVKSLNSSQAFMVPLDITENELWQGIESLAWLGEKQLIQRLHHTLRKIDAEPDYAIEANFELFKATGVFMGTEILLETADPESIRTVAENLSISVR